MAATRSFAVRQGGFSGAEAGYGLLATTRILPVACASAPEKPRLFGGDRQAASLGSRSASSSSQAL